MTLPYERTRAVTNTYDFLCDLLDPKKTPRVPKDIRRRASSCLRHYPSKFDMEMIAEHEDATRGTNPIGYKIFGKTF